MSEVFVYQGKELTKAGHVMDALLASKTQEEALAFMAAYREHTPHADENIGFMLGYYSAESEALFQEWLGLKHPIFGNARPSPEEAYEMGKRAAEEGR